MLKCGFSKRCITPPVGFPMAGGTDPKFNDGVIDDLFTRALVFFDGERYAALITVDVCYMPTVLFDDCRKRISERCGIDENAIIITCSHTHSGPYMNAPDWWESKADNEGYMNEVRNNISSAAEEAIGNLYESKMYTASGEARGVSFVRRYRMKDGSVVTNPGEENPEILEPLGKPNETVKLLKIVREGAKDIYLVNFGTHSCMVGGYKTSADYPGVVCATVEAAIGDCECMFILSAAGDTNHVNVWPSPEEKLLHEEDKQNFSKNRLRAKFVGRAVAGEAIKICTAAKEIKSDGISFGMREISVPSNKGGDLEEAKRIYALHKAGKSNTLPYKDMALITVVSNASRIIRMQTAPDFYTYKLYALSVGDFVFAGLPGEPFTELGNRVMEASPFGEGMLCSITNAMSTYFLTTKAMNEGGYEAAASVIGKGADDIIVDGMKNLYKELKFKK